MTWGDQRLPVYMLPANVLVKCNIQLSQIPQIF